MIFPDTSVWIQFLRNKSPYRQILEHHLVVGNVVTVGVVFAELLQGAKSQNEAERLLRYYDALPQVDEAGLAIEAGLISHSRKAFAKGVGLVDLTILAAARRAQAKIWTLDKKLLSLAAKEEIFHAKK